MAVRQWIFQKWRTVAQSYGFQEYDGPPLEPLDLFTQKSGDEIVAQLYNFTDKGDREVALRPEMTPTFARMVCAAESQYKKPLKWYSIPQLFRYERQQKGRLREHFQLNADVVGESDPGADAELIALLIDCLKSIGLTQDDFVIRLSSRTAWQEFYTSKGGNPEDEYRFYQAIDKMEREKNEVTEQNLQACGIDINDVTDFIERAEPIGELVQVVQQMDDRGLGDFIKIDYHIIRGLAYYTGVVFEAFDRSTKFRAIAGGGRYDKLVSLVSGGKVDMPALGFGMGDVVITELLKHLGRLPSDLLVPDIYFAIDDEKLRSRSLAYIQWFRERGIRTLFPLSGMKADKQFKSARDMKARFIVNIDPQNPSVLTAKNLETKEKIVGDRESILGIL